MKIKTQKSKALAIVVAALLGTVTLTLAADTKDKPTAATTPPASTNSTPAAPEASGPAKFYGPVTSVDQKAKTFTVGDQTFTVAEESHLTKDSKPATLADAVVGEPARGSYTTAKDGKLVITKCRFGKAGTKAGGKTGEKSGGKKKKDSDASKDSGASKDASPKAASGASSAPAANL